MSLSLGDGSLAAETKQSDGMPDMVLSFYCLRWVKVTVTNCHVI